MYIKIYIIKLLQNNKHHYIVFYYNCISFEIKYLYKDDNLF